MQLKVLVICWGIILCRVSPLHDEVLLFRQKDPKPFLPVRGPAGSLRLRTESYGSETRSACMVFSFHS